jgi:hypothetical protein
VVAEWVFVPVRIRTPPPNESITDS